MNKRIYTITLMFFILLQSTALYASPLHAAAAKGDIKAAENWLKVAGKTINDTDQNGHTPLATAVDYDQKDMVVFLLKSGAQVDKKGVRGLAPIHYAACSKNPKAFEITQILLDHGADVNMVADHHKFTPIFYAIMNQNKPMVQFLINKGADLTMRCNMDLSPLQYAHKYGKSPAIEKLLEANGAK
jgi:ankyrin repeat protein